MRLYSKLLTYQKTKCIFVAAIVTLMTGTLLQLQVLYSAQRRNEILILKHDFVKGTGQRKIQAGIRDDVSGVKQANNEDNKTIVSTNWTTNTSTLQKPNNALNMDLKMQLLSSDQIKHSDDSKVVFFLGGQKCGSTTLATYLKHDPNNWKIWDPNGQFMDGGKEFCWSVYGQSKEQFWKHFKTHGSKTATFALDACPKAIERKHFERMVKTFPNASYLMLVRDPVDRVISCLNVELEKSRKGNESIDGFLRKRLAVNQLPVSLQPIRLSMFGNILQTAFSVLPRNKIMIVPNPDLKRQPQQIIDKVMRHIGAKPKNVTLVETNTRNNKSAYQIPSNTTIKWLRNMFYSDWKLFKNISGIHVDTVYM